MPGEGVQNVLHFLWFLAMDGLMSVTEIEFDEGALMPIGVETLRADNTLPFDLYVAGQSRRYLVLYRHRKHPVTRTDIQHLLERGVRDAVHRSNRLPQLPGVPSRHAHQERRHRAARRYRVLREATRALLAEALTQGDQESAVKVTSELSEGMVQTVCDSQTALEDVLRVMSHDYGAFTHSMNVATNCLLLAKRLGIDDQQELLRIGQGGLLHDIGMQYVPRQITDKPGKLTPREQRTVQEHPIHGFKELCLRGDLTWGQLMMVYGHHERCDGQGYPVGLVGPEIHEYARLCAIADAYEAICHDRNYRRASRRRDALEYLGRQAGRAFDEEMMRCWISALDTNK